MADDIPAEETPPAEKNTDSILALRKAYRAAFGSDKGKLVLADLKKRFGFGRWEAGDTEDADKIARRVCMKGPIYYIIQQLESPLENPKRRKARSGQSTQATEPPQ